MVELQEHLKKIMKKMELNDRLILVQTFLKHNSYYMHFHEFLGNVVYLSYVLWKQQNKILQILHIYYQTKIFMKLELQMQ